MTSNGRKRAVIALGGNALSPAGERSTIFDQFRHTRESLGAVVSLAQSGWDVCIVHGNGPQVGDELVRNEEARATVEPLPLGVLVAATAGWIGYMIQQSLENALRAAGADRRVVTVLTQVVVDRNDPALVKPSKFVGHELSAERAAELAARDIATATDGNGRIRRVVGSPYPVEIHEAQVVDALLSEGVIVVACGGGGIPVYRDAGGALEGLDCVVDKDLAAAVLATGLNADLFMILTDVDAVYIDWGKPTKRPLSRVTVSEIDDLDARHTFGEGSMAPKVRASAKFVRQTGGRAIITELSRGSDAVAGRAGTEIVPA
ncbi:MAG: carbamate kinase [Gemmatimonadota bacterium]|nr:carbamate kinase [Gemmatimonadota bacterium]